jgi:hypothetical protein
VLLPAPLGPASTTTKGVWEIMSFRSRHFGSEVARGLIYDSSETDGAPKWETPEFNRDVALAIEDVCDGSIETPCLQREPCLPSKGIRQGCGDLFSVKEGRIGQHLMQVGAVTLPDVVCHAAPAAFVNFGEMRFVLGIDDPDRASSNDHHVWYQMAK